MKSMLLYHHLISSRLITPVMIFNRIAPYVLSHHYKVLILHEHPLILEQNSYTFGQIKLLGFSLQLSLPADSQNNNLLQMQSLISGTAPLASHLTVEIPELSVQNDIIIRPEFPDFV